MQPMQKHLQEIISKNCDSAVLYLQKFPKLPDAGKRPQLTELQGFCGQVNAGKKSLSPKKHYALPMPANGYGIVCCLRSGGRLLVDHSGGLIENSNLCLHHLFGYPMIPGSALKGIARAYADASNADRDQFARIFGGEEKGKSDQRGNVAFLPAVPANNNWEMVVDVLTPHGDSDTKNPIPVFFPAVERGAEFRFQIEKVSGSTSDEDLEAAWKYLLGALTENGVGSKTGAGYGWFEVPAEDDNTASCSPDEYEVKQVESWPLLGLQEHLEECFDFGESARKAYVQKMVKNSASLIRKWRRKNNPNFSKLEELANSCGEILPE